MIYKAFNLDIIYQHKSQPPGRLHTSIGASDSDPTGLTAGPVGPGIATVCPHPTVCAKIPTARVERDLKYLPPSICPSPTENGSEWLERRHGRAGRGGRATRGTSATSPSATCAANDSASEGGSGAAMGRRVTPSSDPRAMLVQAWMEAVKSTRMSKARRLRNGTEDARSPCGVPTRGLGRRGNRHEGSLR